MVNDANVIIPDIVASNGIIHVIDKVLIPPGDEEEVPATTEAPITTEAPVTTEAPITTEAPVTTEAPIITTEAAVPDTLPATTEAPEIEIPEDVEDSTPESSEQHQTTVVTNSKSSKAAHGTKSNKAHPEQHKPAKKSSSTTHASKGGKEPTYPDVHKSATKTSSKTESGKSVSSKATKPSPPPKSQFKGEMHAKSSKSTDAKSHKQTYDGVYSHHINVIDTKAQKVDDTENGNVAYKSSKQSKKVMSM